MDSDFGLVESFNIDDNQLDGLAPQECFVLGYELAQVSHEAEINLEEQDKMVHSQNIDRIEAALAKRERRWRWMWPSDDVSEAWVYLKILPKTNTDGSRGPNCDH